MYTNKYNYIPGAYSEFCTGGGRDLKSILTSHRARYHRAKRDFVFVRSANILVNNTHQLNQLQSMAKKWLLILIL